VEKGHKKILMARYNEENKKKTQGKCYSTTDRCDKNTHKGRGETILKEKDRARGSPEKNPKGKKKSGATYGA